MTGRTDLLPSEDDLKYWMDTFIPSPELWWWDDTPIPNESDATRVIPRGEHRNDEISGNITWVNAYLSWQMTPATKRVIVDDGTWFAGLAEPERRIAREFQVELRRGKCVPRDRFGTTTLISADAIVAGKVVLDRELWHTLPESARRSVLAHELSDWDRATTFEIPPHTPAHIANVANRFFHQEGINCLAVVAYAVSGEPEDLHQWMVPSVFEPRVRYYGYAEVDDLHPAAGDIVVFRSSGGDIVHAAYALGRDRFLNKSGQTTFNPITILDSRELREDWAEFAMSVWQGRKVN